LFSRQAEITGDQRRAKLNGALCPAAAGVDLIAVSVMSARSLWLKVDTQ
jgi:hypothetical protein